MAKIKEFKFEENQQHQKEAIESIVNLFNGYSQDEMAFVLSQNDESIVGNIPDSDRELNEQWLLGNYQDVITASNESRMSRAGAGAQSLPLNPSLETSEGFGLEDTACPPVKFPVFTVEMETGTGKTYTYLRTIHELKKCYGFKKFIVVVPSIAIYEGTISAFRQTRSHFNTLYENENTNLIEYDGSRPDKVKNFATSQSIEIMVMTMQSFNSKGNNIYKRSDKLQSDLLPYQYIQKTRPILILDESQNYRSDKAKAALQTLNPLFAINYSATPVEKYNLVYRLSPVDAFLFNLVKKIEVLGASQESHNNADKIILKKIDKSLKATLRLPVIIDGNKTRKEIIVKDGSDLFTKTGNPDFKGLKVDEISTRDGGKLVFTNQETLYRENGTEADIAKKELYRVQIDEAIKIHFHRQNLLRSRGIKVLSLFFIDQVANYKGDKPFIRELFEEAFEKQKKNDAYFGKFKASEVHNGYFAQKKNAKTGETQYFDEIKESEEGRKLEKEAYRQIMKDKQELLSFDSKISFIFAHSALREGWDNPNVFVICLLKEPLYDAENQKNTRRQELGRGLRICVNQQGERVKDEDANILTVVCPEDFSEYVDALQKEYASTGGIIPPKPTDMRRAKAIRNDTIFTSSGFTDFWKNISRETNYEIVLSTPEIISRSIKAFDDEKVVIPEPKIVLTKGEFVITTYKFELKEVSSLGASITLTITDTGQRHSQYSGRDYCVGYDFFRRCTKDVTLKGFKITEIVESDTDPTVYFGNGKALKKGEPLVFDNEKMLAVKKENVNEEEKQTYPVFNLMDRASKATSLTRPTLAKIFEGISIEKKSRIFYNPEGFSSIFIGVIKNVLADIVAENIVYNVQDASDTTPLERYFPSNKEFPQKELIQGSEHSLYDRVQIDSDVEKRFVKNRLEPDDKKGNVVCYFKFPSDFKIRIPKVILNYNPDWGIVRLDKKGNKILHLVRETKGTIDAERLRFPNERRKITCAKKHFEALGVSYRQVTDKEEEWWLDGADLGKNNLPLCDAEKPDKFVRGNVNGAKAVFVNQRHS